MNIQLIVSDFDGVICKDFYYQKLSSTNPDVFELINQGLFQENKELINSWMRGQVKYTEVNEWIIKHFPQINIDLNKTLIDGISEMKLDHEYLELMKEIKSKGIKLILVSNNMDIFSKYVVPKHNLYTYFDNIYCSADYGLLKHDNAGELYSIVFKKEGILNIPQTFLIDDSDKALTTFSNLGGQTYKYEYGHSGQLKKKTQIVLST